MSVEPGTETAGVLAIDVPIPAMVLEPGTGGKLRLGGKDDADAGAAGVPVRAEAVAGAGTGIPGNAGGKLVDGAEAELPIPGNFGIVAAAAEDADESPGNADDPAADDADGNEGTEAADPPGRAGKPDGAPVPAAAGLDGSAGSELGAPEADGPPGKDGKVAGAPAEVPAEGSEGIPEDAAVFAPLLKEGREEAAALWVEVGKAGKLLDTEPVSGGSVLPPVLPGNVGIVAGAEAAADVVGRVGNAATVEPPAPALGSGGRPVPAEADSLPATAAGATLGAVAEATAVAPAAPPLSLFA